MLGRVWAAVHYTTSGGSAGSGGSGGSAGVCQTSVSSTRNPTFASGSPPDPTWSFHLELPNPVFSKSRFPKSRFFKIPVSQIPIFQNPSFPNPGFSKSQFPKSGFFKIPVSHIPVFQNLDFSKMLGMGLPIVENTPTSLETIFKLSRGPQRPYTKKSKISFFYLILYINS